MSGWRNWLNTFLAPRTPDADGATKSRPQPDIPLAVIGDIHGRADLLDILLSKISKQAADAKLIFVGDYVDRGPESRLVLEKLRTLPGAICIRGNHETMLLEFLDTPIQRGGRWLRNGGTETLASYSITLNENSSRPEVLAAREALHATLSDGTETWLRALPLHWRTGNLLVTHAGPDPASAIAAQDDDVFLWGHSRFLRDSRTDGLWVAHGHWIRDRPSHGDGRINVDTGAWHSGHLTAALISTQGRVNFIRTR